MSPGKRSRTLRDLAIFAAHRVGLSQRVLSDAFDLPRSLVATIVKPLDAAAPPGKRNPHAFNETSLREWLSRALKATDRPARPPSGSKPLPPWLTDDAVPMPPCRFRTALDAMRDEAPLKH